MRWTYTWLTVYGGITGTSQSLQGTSARLRYRGLFYDTFWNRGLITVLYGVLRPHDAHQGRLVLGTARAAGCC